MSHLPSTRDEADRTRAKGFTLIEVLIALAVLTIGLVAVASLFPAGLILQRAAIETTQRQSHTRSVDALLTGLNLSNDELLRFTGRVDDQGENMLAEGIRSASDIDDPIFDVFAVAEVAVAGSATTGPDLEGATVDSNLSADEEYEDEDSLLQRFPLSVRALPTSTPSAGPWTFENPAVTGTSNDPDFALREVYWVPFVRRGLGASSFVPDWSVYAFVLQPPGDLRDQGGYSFNNYPAFFTDALCANPFDPGYFPKVFRLEVRNVPNDEAEATFDVPSGTDMSVHLRVGDAVLGDNGTIYNIDRVDGLTVGLNANNNLLPLNRRELRALWVAPAIAAGEDSPIGDVRLLSNGVVRANSSF